MLHLALKCVGVVGFVAEGGAAGDGDGEGVALGCLLVVLVIPVVWALAVAALVAARCVLFLFDVGEGVLCVVLGVGVARVADGGGAALDVGVGEGVAGVVLGAVATSVAVGSGCFRWRGCCGWRWVWVLLVALLVWVSQSLVVGVGLGVVGRWLLLGVGPRHPSLRAWWAALLAGLPFRPSGGSGGPAPLLAEGVGFFGFSCVVCVCGRGGARAFVCCVCLWG